MWEDFLEAAVKALPTLVVAVVTLSLGWLVGNRITDRWDAIKKRRELDMEALDKFHQLYGEHFAIWKIWETIKRGERKSYYILPNKDMTWDLLERASAVEGGFESLLVRTASQRLLGSRDTEMLARFRQGYQSLRENIRVDKALPWRAASPEYASYKLLASYFATRLSSEASPTPTPEQSASALRQVTSVKYRKSWWLIKEERRTSMGPGNTTLTALQSFKDWSNYLLVTTVAAAGWIASDNIDFSSDVLKAASLWSFGVSIVFGICTLSLIPLIAQQIRAEDESIYRVMVSFSLFNLPLSAYLTQVCRPQHLAFLAGILFLCLGAAGIPWIGLVIAILAVVYGFFSKPRTAPLQKGATKPD